MPLDTDKLQTGLCNALCANVRLVPHNGDVAVVTPFTFPDGDQYVIRLQERPGGWLRVTDAGHTWMQLSYENDVDKFRTGTRGSLLEQTLAQAGVSDDNGIFYIDTKPADLADAVLRLAQTITSINDLTFLNRARAESTFYEDLKESLLQFVDGDRMTADYVHAGLPNASDYPIDYRIDGKLEPLFLFGIPGRDKARLTTIVLERLLRAGVRFDSLLVFADQSNVPRRDLARLSNAGGEMIASLDAREDLRRKVERRTA